MTKAQKEFELLGLKEREAFIKALKEAPTLEVDAAEGLAITKQDTEQSYIELAKTALRGLFDEPLSSEDSSWAYGFVCGMAEFMLIDAVELNELLLWINTSLGTTNYKEKQLEESTHYPDAAREYALKHPPTINYKEK